MGDKKEEKVEVRLCDVAAEADHEIRNLRADVKGLHLVLAEKDKEIRRLREGQQEQALYIYRDGSTKIARRRAHVGPYLNEARLFSCPAVVSERSIPEMVPSYTHRFRLMGEAGPYLVYEEI